jgi:hypothetical protein
MLKGKTGPRGRQPERRFCGDCGFTNVHNQTRYTPGTMATVNGERWIWCLYCREVKEGDQAGKKEWYKRVCKGCFDHLGCECVHPCPSAVKQSGSATVETGGIREWFDDDDPADCWDHDDLITIITGCIDRR